MSKKKRRKHHDTGHLHDSGHFRPYLINTLLFLSLTLIISSAAILLMSIFEDKRTLKAPIARELKKKPDSAQALIKKMGEIVSAEPKVELLPSESEDYEHALKLIKPAPLPPVEPKPVEEKKLPPLKPAEPVVIEKPKAKPPKPAGMVQKPKLAIIIDDVSSYGQVRGLKATGLPLTLSIFPPTSSFPSTPKIARGLGFYMIHLPLEAMNYNHPQEKTLMLKSTPLEIEGRIKEIRRLFPAATMVNNHTGSKFTADTRSMKLLMHTLKKYNFTFVDSRTIGTSKAKQTGEEVGMKVLCRDIFLDNIADVGYIHKQLKRAVELAKKRGYAIAIGHPRESTIEAIKSAGPIVKDVELVYVKELI